MHDSLRQLASLNKDTEIWWDSSPLAWPLFRDSILYSDILSEERKTFLAEELDGIFYYSDPSKWIIQGCTTNPQLSWSLLRNSPVEWEKIISEKKRKYGGRTKEALFRAVYYEVLKRGAEKMMPLFEKSGGKRGHISGQVGAETLHDSSAMMEMAEEIADIFPNMMVKIPATTQGIPVLKKLASKGISTNTTLSYTVAQILAASGAVSEGRSEYLASNQVKDNGWRAVCTHMSGRFEDSPSFVKSLAEAKVTVTPYEMRCASEAVVKKCASLIANRNYTVKLLGSSQRIHIQNGEKTVPHVEMFAGGPIIYTFAPHIMETIILSYMDKNFTSNWDTPPDERILSKLMNSEYLRKGYEDEGYSMEEFDSIEPLIENENEFRIAATQMMDYIGDFV